MNPKSRIQYAKDDPEASARGAAFLASGQVNSVQRQSINGHNDTHYDQLYATWVECTQKLIR